MNKENEAWLKNCDYPPGETDKSMSEKVLEEFKTMDENWLSVSIELGTLREKAKVMEGKIQHYENPSDAKCMNLFSQRVYITKLGKKLDIAVGALETISDAETCEEINPGCEKYNSYGEGWYGVIKYAAMKLAGIREVK